MNQTKRRKRIAHPFLAIGTSDTREISINKNTDFLGNLNKEKFIKTDKIIC